MHQIIDNQTNPNAGYRLLKAGDVAAFLNVSRSFAYHLLQTGELPTVRLGKSVRVRPQDLTEYIENNFHRQVNNP
jgi:excisionase family DNA binding protein